MARQAARWRIDNHAVLQGELYEGAPWVVRELILDVERDPHPGKALVYDLLIEFALADAPGKTVRLGQSDVPLVELTRDEIRKVRAGCIRDSLSAEPAVARFAADLLAEIDSWGVDP